MLPTTSMLFRFPGAAALTLALVLLAGCGEPTPTEPTETEPAPTEPAETQPPNDRTEALETEADLEDETPVVEVMAVDYAFDAPEEIASGWTTFRLDNALGQEVHELSLAKHPEGRSHEDYAAEVLPVWEEIHQELRAGEIDPDAVYDVAEERLPGWADDIRYEHSRGLVSPGHAAQVSLELEPGDYSLECWVKTADGEIHLSLGMTQALTVTDEDSGGSAPETDLEIELSEAGIAADGFAAPGRYSVGVRLEEGPEGAPVHGDLHLIRMDEDTDLAEVASWLDWYQPGGVAAPAPAEFLGGFDSYGRMPAGGMAHFTIEVEEPGSYAWIVNAPPEEELWETFTVQ